jgi:hypothetical protein
VRPCLKTKTKLGAQGPEFKLQDKNQANQKKQKNHKKGHEIQGAGGGHKGTSSKIILLSNNF